MSYAEFLERKSRRAPAVGIDADAGQIHPMLHDWQKELVRWACRTGRAALWADTGMGKTVRRDRLGVVSVGEAGPQSDWDRTQAVLLAHGSGEPDRAGVRVVHPVAVR